MSGPKHILVTGGAGFIGSHTVAMLLQAGNQVTVLDNLFSGRLTNLSLDHPDLTFIEGDILEYPFLADLVREADAVLHLAAIASVPLSIENPIYSFQVNAQGFLHVLEAVRQSDRHTHLVYASSAAVYGEAKTLPCSDEHPLSATALSPYALQKMHNEQYAHLYEKLYGIKSLGLRYFNVYGPGQDPASPYSGVITRFLATFQQGEPFHFFGDGSQSRDFIYVEDIAHANLLALGSMRHGVVNIATGVSETLLALAKHIESAGGKTLTKDFLPKREGDIHDSYGSTEHAKAYLGFEAAVSLQAGIAKMVVK